MGWLFRLAIYVVVIGAIMLMVSCEAPLTLPFLKFCSILEPRPANPLEMQIVPHWYELPIFGALRAATFYVGPMSPKEVGLALLALVLLSPLLAVFSPWSRLSMRAWVSLAAAFFALCGLAWVGAQLPSETTSKIGLAFVALYLVSLFAFPFLARSTAASPGAPSGSSARP